MMLYRHEMNGESELSSVAPCPHCGGSHAPEALVCPNADAVMPLQGRLLAGKFRLLNELGAGGMGVVWQAHHELVHKDVAIKIMRREYVRDAKVMDRFRREATAAGRIGNTHICDILDFGESEIGPFMVMEILQGESLESLFERVRALDPGLIVLIARQALLGLEAAHRTGIVHRDLKPENIFLHEPRQGHLLVKLMDFGISKFSEDLGGGKTEHGVLMGTPEYMSPEQFEGAAKVDELTDIWAMGVLLYRGLTGVMPFGGSTLGELLMQVTSHTPRSPLDRVPTLEPSLSEIVMRCLARDASKRPASAETLHSLLGPHETMSPTAAAESMSAVSALSNKSSAPMVASVPEARPEGGPSSGSGSGSDESWSGGTALTAGLEDDAWTMGGAAKTTSRRRRGRPGAKGRVGTIVGVGLVITLVGVIGLLWSGSAFNASGMLGGSFGGNGLGTADVGGSTGQADDNGALDELNGGIDLTSTTGFSEETTGFLGVATSDATSDATTGQPADGEVTGSSERETAGGGTTGVADDGAASTTQGEASETTGTAPVVKKPRLPKPRAPVDMSLVIGADGRFVPKVLGPKTDYRGARRYCASLRRDAYANLRKWRVPSTGSILRFFKKIDPVVVWTATEGDGGREVVRMLNGFIEVVEDTSKARAVCTSRK